MSLMPRNETSAIADKLVRMLLLGICLVSLMIHGRRIGGQLAVNMGYVILSKMATAPLFALMLTPPEACKAQSLHHAANALTWFD